MPKCLHPPCPNQVTDALYCDEHKYIPHWTTNITSVEQPRRTESAPWAYEVPSAAQRGPSAPGPAPILLIALLVLILAIFAVGLIVILKLIF